MRHVPLFLALAALLAATTLTLRGKPHRIVQRVANAPVEAKSATTPRACVLSPTTTPASAALHGRVVDEAGQPLAAARVVLIDAASAHVPQDAPYDDPATREACVRAAADGAFRFEGLSAGGKLVLFSHEGCLLHLVEATVLDDADLGDIRLERGPTLGGLVVDPDGRPIQGAQVASVLFTAAPELYDRAATDALGAFHFEACPAGPVVVAAGADGFETQTLSMEASSAPARIVLRRLQDLSGRITERGTGRPVGRCRVAVYRVSADGRMREAIGFLDAEGGRYSLGGLPPGEYEVWFRADEGTSHCRVSLGARGVDDADAQIARSGHVSGLVIDGATRRPVPGAVVAQPDVPDLFLATTDERGAFSIDLPEGTQVLTVAHASYAPLVTEGIEVHADETVDAGTLQMLSGGRIEVHATRGGEPCAGVEVFLMEYSRDWLRGSQTTDADGRTVFERVPAGKFSIWHGTVADRGSLRIVEVSGAGTTVVTFDEGGHDAVRGIALDSGRNAPLAGVVVQLVGREADAAHGRSTAMESAQSDAEGRFALARPSGGNEMVLLATTYGEAAGTTYAVRERVEARSDLRVPFGGRALLVHVVDGWTREPLIGADVELLSTGVIADLPLGRASWISSAGQTRTGEGVTLPRLPLEEGTLSVTHEGYTSEVQVIAATEVEVTVALFAGRGGAVRVRTLTRGGQPTRALVILTDEAGVPVQSGYSNSAGAIEFANVRPGSYSAQAEAARSAFVSSKADVREGGTVEVTLRTTDDQ